MATLIGISTALFGVISRSHSGSGSFVADGRRNDALADGHDARNRLDRSRAAQQMAGHGLGGGYLYLVCFVTERFLNGDGLVLSR